MEYRFIFFTFLVLLVLLFGTAVHARPDPALYWRSAMNNQPMPAVIRGLLPESDSNKKMDGQTSSVNKRAFEARPSATRYQDNEVSDVVGLQEHNHLIKTFEPRPSATQYQESEVGNIGLQQQNDLVKNFEPRPSATHYHADEVADNIVRESMVYV